ncbi:trehalose-phosphatase [Bifidobacterium bohemicum]|nr:trehalose-phosphatase [Bifidobacterium bohemicum]
MSRLIIVSNRLPMSLQRQEDGGIAAVQSIGGLATAIGPYFKSHRDCFWVGWSGVDPAKYEQRDIDRMTEEYRSRRCEPVYLTEDEINGYYAGYSNDTIWPLFHDFAHEAKFEPATWKVYQAVNERFAEAVSTLVHPGDTVWVQDYHLMLLPALLRSRFPDLRIGWFLHIPFPSPEIFRQLPNGADLLRGLLGADLVGFHTIDFCINFMSVVRLLLDLDIKPDGRIALTDEPSDPATGSDRPSSRHKRYVTVEAFPIGIDYNLYRRTARSSLAQAMQHGIEAASGKRTRRIKTSLTAESQAATEAQVADSNWWSHHAHQELPELALARNLGPDADKVPRKVVVSVDRLDYTKGLPERLRAFELMLERYPKWVGHVTYYLLATPTRENVETYRNLKQTVDRLVGKVNGKYSLLSWTPIHYITRSLPIKPVCGIYAAGDVALVTPLRDGMNLVAKEYLACHDDRDGALVLSDMCGAARELTDSFVVNPYDIDAVCEALNKALEISPDEARRRNRTMQTRLKYRTADLWCVEFLSTLRQVSDPGTADRRLESLQRDVLVNRWGKARRRLVLCDYDGTLTPLVRTPDRAKPKRPLLDLLRRIGSTANTDFYVVSGRDRATMEEWFGLLPVGLIAEHGVWRSDPPQHGDDAGDEADAAVSGTIVDPSGRVWRRAANLPDPKVWRPIIEELMDQAVERVPKSFVEHKSSTLAWHYRLCDQRLANKEREELLHRLHEVCGKYGLMTMENSKVVEVCHVSISKGLAVVPLAQGGSYDFILAAGDDTTDETMFSAIPPSSFDLDGLGTQASKRHRSGDVSSRAAEMSEARDVEDQSDEGAVSTWTLKIGQGATKARSRLADSAEMIRLLGYLDSESQAVAIHDSDEH